MNSTTTPTLFDTEFLDEPKPAVPRYTLWFRPPGKRSGWTMLYQSDSEYMCVAFMTEHKGGHAGYRILPTGTDPT